MEFNLTVFDWVALGVVIQALAFGGLVIVISKNSQATQLSAHLANAVATTDIHERLAEAGRRFKDAKSNNEEEKMQYELSYISATIETYLVTTDHIRKQVGYGQALVVKGAVAVLVSALPRSEIRTTVAETFEREGYPRIAKFAAAMELKFDG